MRPLGVALLLAGCGEGGEDPAALGYTAAEFAPPAGQRMEFIPPGQGQAIPLWIQVTQDAWVVREGLDWEGAAAVATWPMSATDGLSVDGDLLLPRSFEAGTGFENGTVGSPADREVWYGVFPAAIGVELTESVFGGEVVFAADVGPIAFTLEGRPWELAGYVP